MKTTEQIQHEKDMAELRANFQILWKNELCNAAKSLGIHQTPGCEMLAWKAYLAGFRKASTLTPSLK